MQSLDAHISSNLSCNPTWQGQTFCQQLSVFGNISPAIPLCCKHTPSHCKSCPSCWFWSVPTATTAQAVISGRGGRQIPGSCWGSSDAVPTINQTTGSPARSEMSIPLSLHIPDLATGVPSAIPALLRRVSSTKHSGRVWSTLPCALVCTLQHPAPCSIAQPARPDLGFRKEAWMHLQGCGRGWNHHIQALTHSPISSRALWFAFLTPQVEGLLSGAGGRQDDLGTYRTPHAESRRPHVGPVHHRNVSYEAWEAQPYTWSEDYT